MKSHVIVVGDVMLDKYVTVKRIDNSVTAPTGRTYCLGGAANVAANLSGLGHKVALLGRVGSDICGDLVRDIMGRDDLRDDWLLKCKGLKTVKKTRILENGKLLLRIDSEDAQEPLIAWSKAPASGSFCLPWYEQMGLMLSDLLSRIDAILVVSDYGKRTCSPAIMRDAVANFAGAGRPVLVDPANNGHGWVYYGSSQTTYKVNLDQAWRYLSLWYNDVRLRIEFGAELSDLHYAINSKTKQTTTDRERYFFLLAGAARKTLAEKEGADFKFFWMTLGRDGSILFDKAGGWVRSGSAEGVDEINHVGAGDTALAVMASYVTKYGYDFDAVAEAVSKANAGGQLAVRCPTTYRITKEDLNEYIKG